MCEYCKLKPGVEGEVYNDTPTIGTLENGNQIVDLMFSRYRDYDDGHYRDELILDYAVSTQGSEGYYTVKQTVIPIKYCPFCGEEL